MRSKNRYLSRARWSVGGSYLLLTSLAFAQSQKAQNPSPSTSSVKSAAAMKGANHDQEETSSSPGQKENESQNSSKTDELLALSEAANLDRIRGFYTLGEYQACSEALTPLVSEGSPQIFADPDLLERGRLYLATCLLLQSKRESARRALRAALDADPLMARPDDLTFPPPLIRLFSEVRKEVEEQISKKEEDELVRLRLEQERAKRLEEERRRREVRLYELASQETVVAEGSRWIAALPFGAGQFQNGHQGWGFFFLTAEVVTGSTALASTIILADLNQQYIDSEIVGGGPPLNANEFNRKKKAALTTLTVATWTWIGVTLAGIADAQIRFLPERHLGARTRPLPKDLQPPKDPEESRVEPLAGWLPGGGFVGLRGAF
ncbi:MAG: hypothetical protein MK135_03860 [Polyangiaceae bacterium]|nr:hypothetical protein [Polyangiaceae bacterium]